MKLPTTRQECVKLYDLHRRRDLPMTKFDMYIGGMICCNEKEFSYRKPIGVNNVIGGTDPCLCVSKNTDCYKCINMTCIKATDIALRMPWDAPLNGVIGLTWGLRPDAPLYEHAGQGD